MMKWIFAIMLLISVVFGIGTDSMPDVSAAAMNSSVEAVELFMYLIGGMCMWGGLMRVAEKARITEAVSRLFRPAAKHIFKGLDLNGRAFNAICMNVTANMLGLGNAATPLGLEAMHRLELEENTGDTASRNMIVFIVLNTASITLIPTTAAALRLKHGSASPMDILPCVWLTSVTALITGLITALVLGHKKTEIKPVNNN